MDVTEITAVLEALAAQPALFVEENFARRAEALDELEFHVLDRLDGLPAADGPATWGRVRLQAIALKEQLEAIDQGLFRNLRHAIRARLHTPDSLRAQLAAYMGPGGWDPTPMAVTGYDSLDVLTNGLFLEPALSLAAEVREPEMVYYQKTPARVIIALAEKMTAHDTFYDLGSGLGQVPLLVRLLSGATVKGVEIEPEYCRHAQACADALRLTRVHFLNADARSLEYADGSAFFFFTPFTGRLLQSVFDRLRRVAHQKPVRIFSYGPSTAALAQQPWLRRLDPPDSHLYQLAEFESR